MRYGVLDSLLSKITSVLAFYSFHRFYPIFSCLVTKTPRHYILPCSSPNTTGCPLLLLFESSNKGLVISAKLNSFFLSYRVGQTIASTFVVSSLSRSGWLYPCPLLSTSGVPSQLEEIYKWLLFFRHKAGFAPAHHQH
jgi:hypothetical protein